MFAKLVEIYGTRKIHDLQWPRNILFEIALLMNKCSLTSTALLIRFPSMPLVTYSKCTFCRPFCCCIDRNELLTIEITYITDKEKPIINKQLQNSSSESRYFKITTTMFIWTLQMLPYLQFRMAWYIFVESPKSNSSTIFMYYQQRFYF